MPAPIVILDGGLGTTLEDLFSVRFSSAATPLWSSQLLLTDLPTLAACHRAFALAGADVLSTATYQLSAAALPAGSPTPAQLAASAVRVAADAAPAAGRLALSLGPYGATMVPSQEYGAAYDAPHTGAAALARWHGERLAALREGVAGRVAHVAFETVPRVDEVVGIRKAVGEGWPDAPFWISCLFPREGIALPDGTAVEEALKAMLSRESSEIVPWGVGINCTKIDKLPWLVRRYEEVVRQMVEAGELEEWPSLVLYPDGTNGEVYNTATQRWEMPPSALPPTSPWEVQLADIVHGTRQRGQWRSILVGGCCKASPDHIARLRQAVLGGRGPFDDGKA